MDSLEIVQNNNETYKIFYLFYKSQLRDTYRTKVKMKEIGNGFVIKDAMRGDRKVILNYVKNLRRRGVSSTVTLYAIRDLKGTDRQQVLLI